MLADHHSEQASGLGSEDQPSGGRLPRGALEGRRALAARRDDVVHERAGGAEGATLLRSPDAQPCGARL